MVTRIQMSTSILLVAFSGCASAFTFNGDTFSGSFDSTVTAGFGVRAKGQNCTSVIGSAGGSGFPSPATGAGAPVGCADSFSGYNDQGNLNYAKHDLFTSYLKGTHELLLNMPEDWKFMARVSWLHDTSATRTTGVLSGLGSTKSIPYDARDALKDQVRLLDLWVSKSVDIGDRRVRIRAGNQVISWGESLFLPGGLNQTNSLDLLRLSQPGNQLKEAVLPAPIIDVVSGLGHGLSVEMYAQQGWNGNYFPPVGSYWSTSAIGKGAQDYGIPTASKPRDGGQYGVALRYQPEGTPLNIGFYWMNYHDKSPIVTTSQTALSGFEYSYLENRKIFGASASFPLGNWAIGTELSYRPRDPVTLNASAPGLGVSSITPTFGIKSCLSNGNCYVEEKKYQLHVTALLSLTPSNHGPILKLLGADSATFMGEAVAIRYPGLRQQYDGVPVAAGGWGWGYATTAQTDATGFGTPTSVGTATSYGYNFDFSWVYDGTVVPGWQVIPEVYFFHAVKGRTPNAMATFMEGAKSANFVLSFIQNPAKWQVGLNYAKFWGGKSVFDQPYRDRDFVGAYVSRNF